MKNPSGKNKTGCVCVEAEILMTSIETREQYLNNNNFTVLKFLQETRMRKTDATLAK